MEDQKLLDVSKALSDLEKVMALIAFNKKKQNKNNIN